MLLLLENNGESFIVQQHFQIMSVNKAVTAFNLLATFTRYIIFFSTKMKNVTQA